MTVYITEFANYIAGRPIVPGMPTGAPLQSQEITTGSTYTLSANTRMILVSADAGAWMYLGSSVSTQVASTVQSSTNAAGACYRIPAGLAPFPIMTSPNMRLLTNST